MKPPADLDHAISRRSLSNIVWIPPPAPLHSALTQLLPLKWKPQHFLSSVLHFSKPTITITLSVLPSTGQTLALNSSNLHRHYWSSSSSSLAYSDRVDNDWITNMWTRFKTATRTLMAFAVAVTRDNQTILCKKKQDIHNDQDTNDPVPSHQLKFVSVRGDGRCMFRAIAKGMAHTSEAEQRKLTEKLEREDADVLRMAAWQVICVKKRKFFQWSGFIEGGNIQGYCEALKSPSFYGGETEMFVLADIIRQPIAVYLNIGGKEKYRKIVEYGTTYAKYGARRIRLLYNGVNHYDFLLD